MQDTTWCQKTIEKCSELASFGTAAFFVVIVLALGFLLWFVIREMIENKADKAEDSIMDRLIVGTLGKLTRVQCMNDLSIKALNKGIKALNKDFELLTGRLVELQGMYEIQDVRINLIESKLESKKMTDQEVVDKAGEIFSKRM